MSSFPFIALFSSSLFFSTVMLASSSHWLMMWMALEINMISFLPLIASSNWFQEAEAAMKYFMFQALGSTFILLAASNDFFMLSVLIGSAIKLGIAPFHFWFPPVMNSLNWPMCLTLSTWQKLGPMLIIINTSSKSWTAMILTFSALSALVGGLGGLSQTQMRSLMAYSSIGHMSWILAASMSSSGLPLMYFMFYVLISSPLLLMFWLKNLFSSSLHNKLSLISMSWLMMTMMLLLSLGGLPPLTGFFPKWAILMNLQIWPLVTCLLMGSAMNLYFYLNICLSINTNSKMFNSKQSNSKNQLTLTILFMLGSFMLPMSLYLMYALNMFY